MRVRSSPTTHAWMSQLGDKVLLFDPTGTAFLMYGVVGRTWVAYGDPVESDSLLGADTMSTIYSAYVSAERAGAEVAVRAF